MKKRYWLRGGMAGTATVYFLFFIVYSNCFNDEAGVCYLGNRTWIPVFDWLGKYIFNPSRNIISYFFHLQGGFIGTMIPLIEVFIFFSLLGYVYGIIKNRGVK